FDRAFLQMMITHHEGALTMAKAELADGRDQDAMLMAQNISDGQQASIQLMQQLLAERAACPARRFLVRGRGRAATTCAMTDAQQLADDLAARGVAGGTIHWADNNGIPRSRTVPVASLPQVAEIGVGITTLFAVFDSHDAITYAHETVAPQVGDVRLVPVLEALPPLAGQPALAWVPGRQVAADGSPWPYDQRGVLERQVAALAEQGLSAQVGDE